MAILRVPINGATLTWARKVGYLSQHELGRAGGVSFHKVLAFEAGSEQPTYAQMKKIAKKLDRPLAFFFTDPPAVSDVPETIDYRGAKSSTHSLLARELKRAEYHRQAMIDLEGSPTPVALPAVNRTNFDAAAREIRALLGMKELEMPTTAVGASTLNFWIHKLERIGILVFQTTSIPLDEFRGLSVFHQVLPMVVLNGSDSASGKVFTLFHEMAHLATRTSGICLLDDDISVENLCNSFAQEFLIPTQSLRAFPTNLEPVDAIQRASNTYRVSKLAAAVALRKAGLINEVDLARVRQQNDEDWQANRERLRAAAGGPDFHLLRYRDLGSKFVGTIARALESDQITLVDACYFFNTKVAGVDKIISAYQRDARVG